MKAISVFTQPCLSRLLKASISRCLAICNRRRAPLCVFLF